MNEELHANRKHKDTIFRMLYSDKRAILELYNALNGTDYQNPDDLTVTTLENAVYMAMKNDVSLDPCRFSEQPESGGGENNKLDSLLFSLQFVTFCHKLRIAEPNLRFGSRSST